MCGIVGAIALTGRLDRAQEHLTRAMAEMVRHRGPDAHAFWASPDGRAMFAHRRLSIIDLSEAANQPFIAPTGEGLVFNGEIYNHADLRRAHLGSERLLTHSDTEVMLHLLRRMPEAAVGLLRGMFAFGFWDPAGSQFRAARDPLGIKPFYYRIVDGVFFFASEVKALLLAGGVPPIDVKGLSEYLTFQLPLTERTLFEGINCLPPGHELRLTDGAVSIRPYWSLDDQFVPSLAARPYDEVRQALRATVRESVEAHLVADVEIGSYLSGGIDSSLIAKTATDLGGKPIKAFHGRFLEYPGYDESRYAADAAALCGAELHVADITCEDFIRDVGTVIHALDQPVAGPGSLPQYVVSRLASQHVKVVLGGQGGDEVFGGYTRYLIGYLGEALRQATTGMEDPRLPVRLPEIADKLASIRTYAPLLDSYLSGGLSAPFADKFFRLVDRSHDMAGCIAWGDLDRQHALGAYQRAFNDSRVLSEGSYFDAMAAFDLRFLLPGLLQVEDRLSMAHGLESRVPLTDVRVAEFSARMHPLAKYPQGRLKGALIDAFTPDLPASILSRTDKMGFPVPLREWSQGPARDFIGDLLGSSAARSRGMVDYARGLGGGAGAANSRKLWGLLSLELFFRNYVDQAADGRFAQERERALAAATAQMPETPVPGTPVPG